MDAFFQRYGWSNPIAFVGDGSTRRYFRVYKDESSAILMQSPPDGSPEEGAGHSISDFLCIGGWLREIGLAAPEIYELDEAAGLVLMEDFGDLSFKKALEQGGSAEEVYGLASHVLNEMQAVSCPITLPNYKDSHVHQGLTRVMDYYYPALTGEMVSDDLIQEYRNVWQDIESALPPCPQGFLHIDYHGENLMWRGDEVGVKRCGILDFQGAMIGPLPYDLANLLEDARIDVTKDIKDYILSHYAPEYQQWYRVMGTQFHCRVIGQFIKLAMAGKPTYLAYLPRLQKYLHDGLKDPVLAPLKRFFDAQGFDFTKAPPKIDVDDLKLFIRSEVF